MFISQAVGLSTRTAQIGLAAHYTCLDIYVAERTSLYSYSVRSGSWWWAAPGGVELDPEQLSVDLDISACFTATCFHRHTVNTEYSLYVRRLSGKQYIVFLITDYCMYTRDNCSNRTRDNCSNRTRDNFSKSAWDNFCKF